MTPLQYRRALKDRGLTQNGAARFFHVGPRTGRRWADPEGDGPPESVAIVLALMIYFDLTPEKIAAIK